MTARLQLAEEYNRVVAFAADNDVTAPVLPTAYQLVASLDSIILRLLCRAVAVNRSGTRCTEQHCIPFPCKKLLVLSIPIFAGPLGLATPQRRVHASVFGFSPTSGAAKSHVKFQLLTGPRHCIRDTRSATTVHGCKTEHQCCSQLGHDEFDSAEREASLVSVQSVGLEITF